MKKETISSRVIIYIANILVCFLVFQCFIRQHFSADGYNTIITDNTVIWHSVNGRYFASILEMLIRNIGISPNYNSSILTACFIFECGLLSAWLTREFSKIINKNLTALQVGLINAGTLLCVVNCFISEWYFFSECIFTLYAAGIGGAIAAAIFTAREGKVNFLLGLLMLLISYNSYQISLAIYVFLVMTLIWVRSDGYLNRKFIISTIKACSVAIIVYVMNYIAANYVVPVLWGIEASSRVESMQISNFINKTPEVIHHFMENILKEGNNQMPNWVFGSALLFYMIVCCGVMMYIGNIKEKLNRIVTLLIVIGGGLVCVFLPHLLSGDILWMPNRVCVPIACIFTALIAMFVTKYEGTFLTQAVLAFTVCFLACNAYSIQQVAQDVISTNTTERIVSEQILSAFQDYEEQSGIEIEYIGFTNDEYITWALPYVKQHYCETGEWAFAVEWNRIPCISYYGEKVYKECEVPDEIIEKYKTVDYVKFDAEEQIIFDGNCAYICVF